MKKPDRFAVFPIGEPLLPKEIDQYEGASLVYKVDTREGRIELPPMPQLKAGKHIAIFEVGGVRYNFFISVYEGR